ncbi:PLP-dependent aminotransferase family protein [Paenibacillus sp. J5C_2022]|uniref:aminotransferase-like domain-containing protein n=1 Tax=Paenibacillus sp. J5C2022 TaxID=2977129 RepID=UPI0021D176A6|nr:PLP-dependent aminotransferase family protein [Paenibacillus sp. J5C2022]MCU6709883.1 PLP-dependent aminotransferase family protein [Paenibacillus sp. J5C2022]
MDEKNAVLSFGGHDLPMKRTDIARLKETAHQVWSDPAIGRNNSEWEGLLPYRRLIGDFLHAEGAQVEPEQLLLMEGTGEAVGLALRTLAAPGDYVLLEQPADDCIISLCNRRGLLIAAADSDGEGIVAEQAERLIVRHRPKLMLAVPDFRNPTGGCWSLERRRKMLQLCMAYGVTIVEHDLYGHTGFQSDHRRRYPSLLALASVQSGGSATVVQIGSLTDTLAPVMRSAWIATANEQALAVLRDARQESGDAISQTIAYRYLEQLNIQHGLRQAARGRRQRLTAMVRELRHGNMSDLNWTLPEGGIYLWLGLPEGLDADALLRASRAKGVTFHPGASCYVHSGKRNTARLNFALHSPKLIASGMQRLIEAIGEFTARR